MTVQICDTLSIKNSFGAIFPVIDTLWPLLIPFWPQRAPKLVFIDGVSLIRIAIILHIWYNVYVRFYSL